MTKSEHTIISFLLPPVVNAAIKAGAAIMEIYNKIPKSDIDTTVDRSPIVEANRDAQNIIKETLGPTRIPILSEEGREMLYEERCNWEMFWLVDPLDGTVEFLNHNGEFTVNIALMNEGRAIAGVIYVPCREQLYIAGEGFGAYLRRGVKPDTESDMSYAEVMENLLSLPLVSEAHEVQCIAVSRSHITPETLEHIEQLRLQHPNLEVVKQGSSFKFCLLAEGKIDYYVRTSTTYEWDTAAGEAILAEAGGVTKSLVDDSSLKYNKEELHNPWFRCHSAVSKIR